MILLDRCNEIIDFHRRGWPKTGNGTLLKIRVATDTIRVEINTVWLQVVETLFLICTVFFTTLNTVRVEKNTFSCIRFLPNTIRVEQKHFFKVSVERNTVRVAKKTAPPSTAFNCKCAT